MKICKCNNCDTIMWDENPQPESYDFTEAELKNIQLERMIQVADGEYFNWACPKCKKDDYLMDITTRDFKSIFPAGNVPIRITDLLALIHLVVIKDQKENPAYQHLEAFEKAIKSGQIKEDYDVTDHPFWKSWAKVSN